MDVGGQQVVAAVLVLVPLQVLVDLVDQQRHGLERRSAQVDCGEHGGGMRAEPRHISV